jgi:hypothetical protein
MNNLLGAFPESSGETNQFTSQREALKEVIAEHLKLEARDDERQETARKNPTRRQSRGPGVIKIKSCPQQDPRQTDLFQQDRYKDQIGFIGSGGVIRNYRSGCHEVFFDVAFKKSSVEK